MIYKKKKQLIEKILVIGEDERNKTEKIEDI